MELSCGSRVFSFCELLFSLQSSEEEKTGVWGLRGRMGMREWGAAGREGKRVTENLEATEEGGKRHPRCTQSCGSRNPDARALDFLPSRLLDRQWWVSWPLVL